LKINAFTLVLTFLGLRTGRLSAIIYSASQRMIEKYFIKWSAPAREDLNEIIEYIGEIIVDYWRIIYKTENDIVYIMAIIDGRKNVEDIILKKIILRENEL
jgi:hypothetical protein